MSCEWMYDISFGKYQPINCSVPVAVEHWWCPHFVRRFTDNVPEFWHGDRLKEDVGFVKLTKKTFQQSFFLELFLWVIKLYYKQHKFVEIFCFVACCDVQLWEAFVWWGDGHFDGILQPAAGVHWNRDLFATPGICRTKRYGVGPYKWDVFGKIRELSSPSLGELFANPFAFPGGLGEEQNCCGGPLW